MIHCYFGLHLYYIYFSYATEWRNQGDFVYLRLKGAPTDCASTETVQVSLKNYSVQIYRA